MWSFSSRSIRKWISLVSLRTLAPSALCAFLLSIFFLCGRQAAWAGGHLVPPLEELEAFSPYWKSFLSFREFLRWAGGVFLALSLLITLLHFARYGYHHIKPSHKKVTRYSGKEVALHAVLAFSFIGAWASSTYLILGKYLLGSIQSAGLPFGWLMNGIHLTAGILFFLSIALLVPIWWNDMRLAAYDWEWLRKWGGYFSGGYPTLPAGRFNAGQKIWFHLSILSVLVMVISGALLYFHGWPSPAGYVLLFVVHTLSGVILSACVMGHVYLSVIVHPHAFPAMITGKMDEAALRADHPLANTPETKKDAA